MSAELRVVPAVLVLAAILVPWRARAFAADAAPVVGDRWDDPKIVRRFGATSSAKAPGEASVPVAPPRSAAVTSAQPSVAPAPTSVAPAPTSVAPAPTSVAPAPTSVAPAPTSVVPVQPNVASAAPSEGASVAGSDAGYVGASSPEASVAERRAPESQPWGFAPRAELTWRYLPLFRVGAQQNGNATGKVANEGFQVLSGRLFPMSSLFRLGASVDFGWETGKSPTGGDYFLSESTSFGLQRLDRITPFLEAVAGGGYMRRLQVGVSVPTGMWFYGAEGGVDIYTLDRLYIHLSLGRMRVVNAFAQLSAISRVFEDVWFFRLGVGL